MTSESIRSLLAYGLPAIEREFKLAQESEHQQMDMRQAINATRDMLGLKGTRKEWQPHEIEAVRQMMQSDATYAECAAQLGRSTGSIDGMVNKIRKGKA